MLSLQLIREHPEEVRRGLARRGASDAPLDELLRLDGQRRRTLQEVEALRGERNALSKEVGELARLMKTAGTKEAKHAEHRRSDLVARSSFLGEKLDALETQLRDLEGDLRDLLLQVPNLPASGVPDGPGARLQRALIAFMLDLHLREGRYREVYLPAMIKEEAMLAAGQLPKFADNLYHDAEEDFWFIPTAEVPLTNLHRDEILEPGTLPLNYVAFTPCFRREKMSAGRDVRGIKRGHQFDKVELYRFVEPERSSEALQELVGDARSVCRALGIPHRVVQLCTGDLGFNAAGLALPRTLIAVLENYQQPDGSVAIPGALRPYMGDIEVIRPAGPA